MTLTMDVVTTPQAAPRPVRQRMTRRLPRGPRGVDLFACIVLLGYIAAAIWLKYVFHFAIGDALARSADAKYMLFSRDPHAAAIGVYWMPLPTLVQVPLMAFLGPLGHPEFAGPLSSALWSAGTIAVLGRLARDLGVSSKMRFLLVAAYALNPLVIYYAAVGMSEACEFFWIAVALWGLFRYLDDPDRTSNSLLTGLGLAGMCITKYEITPAVGLAVAFVAVTRWDQLRVRRWHLFLTDALAVSLPAIFVTVIWFLYMRIITGSFTTFIAVGSAGQQTQTAASVGPAVVAASHSVVGTARFALRYQLELGPALLCAFLLLVRVNRQRLVRLAVILSFSLLLVAATLVELHAGNGIGNPRYFTTATLMGIISCMAVASGGVQKVGSRLVGTQGSGVSVAQLLLLVLPVVGWITAINLESGPTYSLESENRVFAAIADRPVTGKLTSGDIAPVYEQVAEKMDSLTKPGDLVLTDTQYEGEAALYSKKLDQWIVRSDRDYQKITDPDAGGNYRMNWAIIVPTDSKAGFSQSTDHAGNLVRRQPGEWTKVWSNSVAEIWHRSAKYNIGLPNPPSGG